MIHSGRLTAATGCAGFQGSSGGKGTLPMQARQSSIYTHWPTNWTPIEKKVESIQRQIEKAAREGNGARIHKYQRRLWKSLDAKLLAVRRVTELSDGRDDPGVDGRANLNDEQKYRLAMTLVLDTLPDPLRGYELPKENGGTRLIKLPTMRDRAKQALVRLALEPEWEVKLDQSQYGCRSGRSTLQAIAEIAARIWNQPTWVLRMDIEKFHDNIRWDALLEKLGGSKLVQDLVRGWITAEVHHNGRIIRPSKGIPQGGVISPLLANIVLAGLEQKVTQGYGLNEQPLLVSYVDDLLILHPSAKVLQECRARVESFLEPLGLHLGEEKTSLSHTLVTEREVKPGAHEDLLFLGWFIKQYPLLLPDAVRLEELGLVTTFLEMKVKGEEETGKKPDQRWISSQLAILWSEVEKRTGCTYGTEIVITDGYTHGRINNDGDGSTLHHGAHRKQQDEWEEEEEVLEDEVDHIINRWNL